MTAEQFLAKWEGRAVDLSQTTGPVGDMIGSAATTASQRAALTAFAWLVGLVRFKGSAALRRHLAGDYEGAAAAFEQPADVHPNVKAALRRLYRGEA